MGSQFLVEPAGVCFGWVETIRNGVRARRIFDLRCEEIPAVRLVVFFEIGEGIFEGFLITCRLGEPNLAQKITFSAQNIKVSKAVGRIVTAHLQDVLSRIPPK